MTEKEIGVRDHIGPMHDLYRGDVLDRYGSFARLAGERLYIAESTFDAVGPYRMPGLPDRKGRV